MTCVPAIASLMTLVPADTLPFFPNLQKKPIDIDATKAKGKRAARGLISGRIQGEARESALIQVEQLAEYFEDKVSGEDGVKDELFDKLNNVVRDVQGKPVRPPFLRPSSSRLPLTRSASFA